MQVEKLLRQAPLKKYPWFRKAILRISLLPGFQKQPHTSKYPEQRLLEQFSKKKNYLTPTTTSLKTILVRTLRFLKMIVVSIPKILKRV